MRWLILAGYSAGCLAGCRDRPAEPVDAAAPSTEEPDARPARSARASAPDAAMPLDAACEGMTLSLVDAVLDPRCELSEHEWMMLHDAPGLAQEAHRDGDRVVFALANHGPKAIDVPLRFDDRHPDRAFSVVAETDGGLFALASPTFELHASDAGAPEGRAGLLNHEAGAPEGRAAIHVHSARIRLPPGATASATLAINLAVAERIDRRDAAAPKRLEGPITLHLGQFFCPLDAGDPATVR